jgi:hypothetical protein
VKENDSSWKKVYFYSSFKELYLYLLSNKIDNLYINCDISTILSVIKKIKKISIYTYEEGFGSYSLHRWKKNTRIQTLFDNFLGNSELMNDASWLSGCFLYYPSLFKDLRPHSKINVIQFKYSFYEFLYKEKKLLDNIFIDSLPDDLNVHNKKILIYVTSWDLNTTIINDIIKVKEQFDLVLIKLHPHMNANKILDIGITLNSFIMAEYLFIFLLSNNNQLTVYHENSTSLLYFKKIVKLKNYGKDSNDYNRIASYIV